jgi:hypothetical protein
VLKESLYFFIQHKFYLKFFEEGGGEHAKVYASRPSWACPAAQFAGDLRLNKVHVQHPVGLVLHQMRKQQFSRLIYIYLSTFLLVVD